jgi:menaquinone-specific isochorismate synthase
MFATAGPAGRGTARIYAGSNMSSPAPRTAPLPRRTHGRGVRAQHPRDLLTASPVPSDNVCFVTGGAGVIGWGRYASLEVSGPDAAARITAWLADVAASVDLPPEPGLPVTGPIAFVSMGFDDTDTSVAIVPSTVLGSVDGVAFRIVLGSAAWPQATAVAAPGAITWSDPTASVAGFTAAVATATGRIRAGELEKVVLARDLHASTERPVDERFLLRRLAEQYPACATFAVDGLLGASPELVLRRFGRRISSRVLAGTAWPHHTGEQVGADELASPKNLAEHRYAVESVARTLAPLTSELQVPGHPSPLPLANLTHLSTDVAGLLADPSLTALQVAALMHPTAAVGGSPTEAARRLIRELEPAPRGRYAAPVGWQDAAGNGEFALALRCAQISGRDVRLLAGCGIVAGSDPAAEAQEAEVKMIPMRDALQG